MSAESFDVIVVGSGPSGSAFARTFADLSPDARILMLEVGPKLSSPPGRHVRRIVDPLERERAQTLSQGPVRSALGLPPARVVVPDETGRLPVGIRPGTFLLTDGMTASDSVGFPAASMTSNVGGMGAHWSCACPVPGEGEMIPFIPADEFAADLDHAYRLLHVTQHAFDDSALAQGVCLALGARFDAILPEGRKVQAMPMSLPPDVEGHLGLGGTETILGHLPGEPHRFTLRPDTLVTRLVCRGSRVVGVHTRSMVDGREAEVHAGVVFVAADPFRTPQLLHNSGIRPPALGRYLNDHPDVRCFVQLNDGFRDLSRGTSEAAVGGLARDAGVTWIPYDRKAFPFSVQVMQIDASPVDLDERAAAWPGAYIGIVVFGCKELSPEDRVTFSDTETDAYGMPALRIHYELTARDHETYGRIFQAEDEIARTLGSYVNGGPAALQVGGSYHFMGSVRMGAVDDDTSVCDSRGQVWGVDGLLLGGNGVIPTATACNPTATNVALAVRAARQAAA